MPCLTCLDDDKVIMSKPPRLVGKRTLAYQWGCSACPGGSLRPWGLPKEWDLFYSNQGGEWNDYARNWTLAKASFKRLITELNIKVALPSLLLLASDAACIHSSDAGSLA